MLIKVKRDCGCCYEYIAVNENFRCPDEGNGQTIYDKFGIAHCGLDTFYGYEIV